LVNFYKLTSAHTEIRLLVAHRYLWANIRYSDLLKGLFTPLQVAEVVNERVDFKLFCMLALVQNEIAAKEHKVCKLVALRLVVA
jgi:hypothetical protein